jgi:3-hydroxy-9,10-secoandrosta-1,3,5(10)-triene-9,17-dione monooxygenase reductase component
MILRISQVSATPVCLEEPDDCSRLHVVVAAPDSTALLEKVGLGPIRENGSVALDPRLLQLMAHGRVGPEWSSRFDEMIAYADRKGWLTPDGRVLAHVEYETEAATAVAIDPVRYKRTIGRFPSGVTVVAALCQGVPVGFTCQTFISLSLRPPLIAIAASHTSTSWPRILRSGGFCVSVLAEHHGDLSRRFAVSGGDKFTGVDWKPSPDTGSPVISEAVAWIDCRLEAVYPTGDHDLIVGRVVYLDEGATRPLVFHESRLSALAKSTYCAANDGKPNME